MSNKTQQPSEVVRLNASVYKALEAQVAPIHVQRDTTELQAGYQLGVQAVLRLLREGYVVP